MISGEQQEVDGVLDSPESVLDAAALGIPKGWIMLGHAVSEEAGMLEMAQSIKDSCPKCRSNWSKPASPSGRRNSAAGVTYGASPSLKGVWYRGHYLHDGTVASLEELLDALR